MNSLCLSGHLRIPNRSIIKIFKDDIFIVLWDKTDIDGVDVNIEEVKDIFRPKKIVIENYDFFHCLYRKKYEKIMQHVKFGGEFHKGRKGWDSYCMWYLIKKVGEMKRLYEMAGNFRYETVIRARPDFTFNDIKDIVEPNTLYFPVNSNYKGITDNCFYGNSETMDTAFMCYDMMDSYILKENCEWVNEKLFYHHINKFDIKIKQPCGFNYEKNQMILI